MNIDNQSNYWDSVAQLKTFTHPLDVTLLKTYVAPNSKIVDFGCGYGRIVKELNAQGYKNVVGFDTSKELVNRGKQQQHGQLYHIEDPQQLPIEDDAIDCIILFAVLTCIPSNSAQKDLIQLLHAKLKRGGILYISDYYLQQQSIEVDRYYNLNEDAENYGVFNLPEGAVFRHHTKEWMTTLLKQFTVLVEKPLTVMTMNGHQADGFQLIAQK